MDGGFGGLDRKPVHHLDRRRQYSRGDDLAHRAAGVMRGVKRGNQNLYPLRPLHQPQNNFGSNPQRAFRTNENPAQIVPRSVRRFAPEVHQRTVRQHHFQPAHMSGGKAIFQAVRAAGILSHVSADAADLLRRRIRRIEIVARGRRGGDVEIDDPRFHHHDPVFQIHFENSVHAVHADYHPALDRQRPAAQSSARASRHKRNAVLMAHAEDGLNFSSRGWKKNRFGPHPKIGQPVALVGVKLFGPGNDRGRWQRGAKLGEDFGVHVRSGATTSGYHSSRTQLVETTVVCQ